MVSIRIASPIKTDVPIKVAQLVSAGASLPLDSENGPGYATVVYQGDGDGLLTIQAVVDGNTTPEDSFSTNETRIGAYSFQKTLVIQAANPGTASVTATTATVNVRGIKS